GARRQHGEAARSRAEIEHATDTSRVLDQPRALAPEERPAQDLADEGAEHDHALVDMERHAADIGAAQQIGGGLARGDTRLDQTHEPPPLVVRELSLENGLEPVDRQMQALEDQKRRLVARVVGAMAENELRRGEYAHGMAEHIADRRELGRRNWFLAGTRLLR